MLFRSKEVGTIEPGKRADLILLDADPLSDPDVLANPDHVRLVAFGGEIVKDLDAILGG